MTSTDAFDLIETWDTANISIVLNAMKKDLSLKNSINKSYKGILDDLGGTTIKKLVGLDDKWQNKLNNKTKYLLTQNWPSGRPFLTDVLDFKATRRVNSYRETTITNTIDFDSKQFDVDNIKETKELYLDCQTIDEITDKIVDFEALEILSLKWCEFDSPHFEALKSLTKLRVLDLSFTYYNIDILPNLSHLEQLEEIDLEYVHLKEAPDWIFSLPNLKKITTTQSSLDRNTAFIRKLIQTFPEAEIISRAKEAVALEDQNNENEYLGKENIKIDEFNLNKLPSNLFDADVVKTLEIKCSNLTSLEGAFERLQSLENLILRFGNDIEILPQGIGELKKLKSLTIEGFSLKKLFEHPAQLISLEYLEIDSAKIEEVLQSIMSASHLKTVKVRHWKTTGLNALFSNFLELEQLILDDAYCEDPNFMIDKSLSELTNLQEVTIALARGQINNQIFHLPKTIKNLQLEVPVKSRKDKPANKLKLGFLINLFKKLEKIKLKGFDISNTTTPIKENNTLKTLDTDYCHFPLLPDSIKNLKALTNVCLFSTLDKVNAAIYECTELKNLRIIETKNHYVPDGIEKLVNIEYLGFGCNMMSQLPEGIYELKNLKQLILGETTIFKDTKFKAKIKRKIKGLRVTKHWY